MHYSYVPVAWIDPRGLLVLMIDVVHLAVEIGGHVPAIGQRYLCANGDAIDVRWFSADDVVSAVAGRHRDRVVSDDDDATKFCAAGTFCLSLSVSGVWRFFFGCYTTLCCWLLLAAAAAAAAGYCC